MSWSPLSYRLEELPLILAGPILKKTEKHSVTVWVALKKACTVKLQVYTTQDGRGNNQQAVIFAGIRETVAVGQHLHILAVTAKSINGTILESGNVYLYDLSFQPIEEESEKLTLRQALEINLSYFEHGLPSFVLPPQNINHLRIAQGSCRKPQGEGLDALPILDDLIKQYADNPNLRLHQLFLTGDQVYADDVADPLLFALTDIGDTLLGWEESLPLASSSVHPKQLKPGKRSQVAKVQAGLTAGLPKKIEAKSHLMSYGEYCATYLLFWSSTLWPHQFPSGQEIHQDSKLAKQWDKELKSLTSFIYTLNKVQRLLANIPTYMIFDDHDISDDWYLNQEWCLRVLGKPLGRRTVQNGLLAYSLFQAWGNIPEQFTNGESGEKLLELVPKWSQSQGNDPIIEKSIASYLGLPPIDPKTGLPQMRQDGDYFILDTSAHALKWHYTVRTHNYEVLILNTRTQRGYPVPPAKTIAPPSLLSPTAFEQQIQKPLQQTKDNKEIQATLVIAPTNLVSLQLIDWVQERELKKGKVFGNDVGDGWNLNESALATLLKVLFEQRQQVIVLSGDIHYGSAVRLEYQKSSAQNLNILVQMTSSSLSNAELKTRIVHTKLKSLFPEAYRKWYVWFHPAEVKEIKSAKKQFLDTPDAMYSIKWIKRQPSHIALKDVTWLKSYHQMRRAKNWLSFIWKNKWLQEGTEVVGLNNLGVISFNIAENTDIIQDLYWYAPWKPNNIVFSRYTVLLEKL
ncbi:PhoD-like phosphatase [Aphanothece hegewaldii CCALA 016]|uniref:PhoD-like phosphatase n=1 Tax=Aphanothece hegewaldii CCALA 016 TaxID=2107694 RepID=A0A2T1LX74_9CHRO|nr:PhoD-like phosphatase [Aphanothece hegewaldii]PSF36787.1 PhoD-like phosphatase [Aphanothece hegewaldii CCALA 016]